MTGHPTVRTVDGARVPAVTAAEMREIDRIAVEDFGLDLLQLMENAGRTLARHVRPMGDTATVVAGNGGNGGGGLACARHLVNRDVAVSIVLDRPRHDLDGASARQLAVLDAMDVPVHVGPAPLAGVNGVVVDALIGYGLEGPVRGTARALVRAMDEVDVPTVSLDVPSGRDATTGEATPVAVSPDRLVTLALPTVGLGAVECPRFLAAISIPAGVFERSGITYDNPFGERYWVELEPPS